MKRKLQRVHKFPPGMTLSRSSANEFFLDSCLDRRAREGVRRDVRKAIYHAFKLCLKGHFCGQIDFYS